MKWLEITRQTQEGESQVILAPWPEALRHIPRTDETCSTAHFPRITTGICACLEWDLEADIRPDLSGVRAELISDPEAPAWYGDETPSVLGLHGVVFVGPARGNGDAPVSTEAPVIPENLEGERQE